MLRSTFADKEVQRKCGGVCCKRFYLPMGPDVITEDWHRYLRGEPTRFAEIGTIAPMLKHLETRKNKDGRESHYYTCNYIDDVSGLCLIYSHRPHMCWAYPYGGNCNYHGCSDKPFLRRCIITRPLWIAFNKVKEYVVREYYMRRLKKEVLNKLPSTFDDKLVELSYTKVKGKENGEEAGNSQH